jgi:thiamine kinase-like enzyme
MANNYPERKEERFKGIIEFKGERWNHIKDRLLTNSRVYKSVDGSKYLHIGNTKNIKKEASFLKKLHKLGFPVSDLLEYGKINNYGYYIERSVGKKSYGDKFRKEYASQVKISSDTLESLSDTVCNFLASQLKSSGHFSQKYDLRKNIMLANVLRENPDLDAKKIETCISKIENKLRSLPVTFSHSDLTPRNIFKTGIIDLEFSSTMPVGYDVLTAPIMERFWGFGKKDIETHEDFYLKEEQISHYYKKIEAHAERNGIRDFLTFTDDFILLKAIWSLAHEKRSADQSGDTSKLNFRKKILIYCLEQYLNNERIETKKFKTFIGA